MSRTPSPWYRKDRDAWYVTLEGQRHKLAEGKESKTRAMAAFGELLAEQKRPKTVQKSPNVAELIVRFLQYARGQVARDEIAPATLEHYEKYLAFWAIAVGHVESLTIKPFHLTERLDTKPTWNATTRCGAITAIKRVFAWAKQQGIILENPIVGFKKPSPLRREEIPDAATLTQLMDAFSPGFRLLLEVIHRTGCRPGEARLLAAKDLDIARNLWVKAGKTTRKTKRKRVVHVPIDLMVRLAVLAKERPTGPILLNRAGKPWRQDAIGWNIRRVRNKLGMGKEVVAYGLRHLFATDGLDRGVPIATVAELMGHASTKMIAERYSHLADRHEHLKSALGVIRGDDTT